MDRDINCIARTLPNGSVAHYVTIGTERFDCDTAEKARELADSVGAAIRSCSSDYVRIASGVRGRLDQTRTWLQSA